MNDKDLIKACGSNDPKAQRLLYETYGPVLMGICLRYAGMREEAEEIFHDAMMKVYKSIRDFRGESSLKTWMGRIGVNTALDHLRKKKKMLMVEYISDHALEIADSDVRDDISLEGEEAMRMLNTLSLNQRIIINLYVIDELSHREIAEKLQISEEASRAQYSRAKRLLAELCKKKGMKNESR